MTQDSGVSSSNSHWRTAQDLTDAGTAFVVVTMVACRGHVPQDIGAKAIITEAGIHQGTIGGGKVEAKAIARAQQILKDAPAKITAEKSAPEMVTWNLTTDVGMTCGGEVTFLFETHNPKRWLIAVFGAGHVSQALVRTLQNLECHVTCLDTRSEWLDKLPKSVKITKVLATNLSDEVPKLSSEAFFVVMTQGHATDLPVLEKIYRTFPEARYIGVMGSDVKAKKMRHDLVERGIGHAAVEKLHSPIGLRLGGNQPFEIAISIAAELMQVRDTF